MRLMKRSTLMAAAGLLFTLQFSPVSANDIKSAQEAIASQNYSAALNILQPMARDGNLDAANLLGQIFENGWGVEEDATEAERLYSIGANQGHLDSVTHLRALKNKAYAVEFKRLSPLADAGNAEAQNTLGEMYEFGKGVERNTEEAYRYYSLAADQGLVAAWHNLGRCYNFGTGVEQNYETAEHWYRQAAERGHTPSLFFLGTLYATDHGTDSTYSSDIIAFAWLKNAADLGDKTAQPIAQRLLMKLNDTEVETAKQLAETYKARYIN